MSEDVMTEDRMRAALDGQFTTYVGNPCYDEKRANKRKLLQQRKEEKQQRLDAERQAKVERDLENARKANLRQHEPDQRLILAVVAKAHGVPVDAMMSHLRKRAVMLARHHAIWELKQRKPSMSKTKLGYLFHRDHSTVINSLEYVDANPDEFATMKEIVEQLLTEALK